MSPADRLAARSDPGRSRRPSIGFITLLAALAGLAAGRQLALDDGGWLGPILLLVSGAAVVSSATVDRRGRKPLRSTGMEELRRELDRARRHRRSFAMLRLEAADRSRIDEVPEDDVVDQDVAILRLLGASLRITDRAWPDGDGLIILMPESDRPTARVLADRILAEPGHRFAGRFGVAVFPDDGLTSGALLDALERDARGDALPSPLVPASALIATPDAIPRDLEPPGDDVESGTG